ncbi:2S seed storage protein-like [Rutidosis leptorrhynchoides]|uniref:2S seed storage protein-like n=1 Tax=Rutidosis leptorrhynchoides TaxID=125765 RepID=UPI003A9A116B
MAKLLVLTVALAALVAFATAHPTIVTTTIEDDNGYPPWGTADLDVCQQYLQQSIQSPYENYQPSQSLQQLCCQQLQNVDDQRQCDAVKQVFQDVLLGQQGGRFGAQEIRQLRQKAQQLPNECNLQVRSQCQPGNIRRTVDINVCEEDNYSRRSSRGSQQCSEVQGRQFNQCQRYIQQQQQQGGSLLMSINRQGQQQQQELRSCCNELENVQRECQCEAMQEVYEQATRQQQQQQGRRQSGRRTSMEPQMVQRAIQNLKNECNLQVQQCRVPSATF